MDLDTEETRETHNLYIESTRKSLKNINKISYLMFRQLLIKKINLKKFYIIFSNFVQIILILKNIF